MTVRFDPHSGHSIVENFVLFQKAQTTVVHEHTAILAAPDFVTTDLRVAASPETKSMALQLDNTERGRVKSTTLQPGGQATGKRDQPLISPHFLIQDP